MGALLALLAAALVSAPGAGAAACTSQANGSWISAGTWTCGEIPDSTDDVTIAGHEVTVPETQGAASLTMTAGSVLKFLNALIPPSLTVGGAMTVDAGIIDGPGTLTVGGAFTKTTAGQLTIQGNADLVLNSTGTFSDGQICGGSDSPSLGINAAFTIGDVTATTPFNCSSPHGRPFILIGPNGQLIDDDPGATTISASVDNDGQVVARTGLLLLALGTQFQTGGGDYVVSENHTLEFAGAHILGEGADVTGAGTFVSSGTNTIGDGANLDVATLRVTSGSLSLSGSGIYAPQTIDVAGGHLISSRDTSPSTLSVATGTIDGDHTITPVTFAMGPSSRLDLRGGADLVLETATHLAGVISGTPPATVQVRAAVTIPRNTLLRCDDPDHAFVRIGPGGSLQQIGVLGASKMECGVLVEGGTLIAGAGRELRFEAALTQTSGATTIAATGSITDAKLVASGGTVTVDGTFSGAPETGPGGIELTGPAVLTGSGTVAQAVVNQAGTVRPGSSPGTLTVDTFSQGPNGTLEIEVDGTAPGTGFDRIVALVGATLGGTVVVDRDPGFQPADGDTFHFLVTPSTADTNFDALTAGILSGGRTFALDHPADGTGARLIVAMPGAPGPGTPTVVGTPQVGQTVTCDPGTWTGSPAFTFEWLLGGAPIAGATASTYAIAGGDAGRQLACRVTGTNASDTATATSAAVLVAAPPPSPPPPTGSSPAPSPTSPATAAAPPASRIPAATATERRLAAASVAAVAKAFGLPSARRCLSRRRFAITVRRPKGVTVSSVVIEARGKRLKVRRAGSRYTATVDLRGLRKGRFTVKIRVKTASQRTLRGSRRYRTCLPKARRR